MKSFSIDSNPIVSADKSFRSLFGVDSPMVETVEIGESVISIGNNAFEGFYKLKNITFPNSIVSIGSNSFCGTKLLEIELPQNLETIGEAAFLGSYLTSVTIPKSVHSIGKDAFGGYYGSMVANVVIEGDIDGLEICNVFGSSVEVCHLGEGVTKIDNRMFKDCSSLKSVSCSNTIDFIGSESFRGCSSLESFAIPMGVKSIGWGAFMDCYNLKEVSLPPSLQEVESVAFENCRRLEKVLVIDIDAWWHIDFKTYQSNPVTISHDLMLNGASVEHLVMPDDVDVVGLAQFKGLEKLKSVELNNHVSEISAMAFDGCSALETINFPSSLTKIWGWAFRDCHSLNVSVDLSDTNVELLGGGSFLRCTSIPSVALPASLKYIYTEVFKDDTSIKAVYSYINEPLNIAFDYASGYSLEPFACTLKDGNQQGQEYMTIYQHAVLYVPGGTTDSYRNSPIFREFSTIEEMNMSTDKKKVLIDKKCHSQTFDLKGRHANERHVKGLYINDGLKVIK